jgi:hypothetical protein
VGTYWVDQAAWDALSAAIAAAEGIAAQAGATQADVDAAIGPLTAAATAFAGAKQPGTRPATDKTALTGAIAAANAAKTGIVVDADGGNVPVGTSWVTQDTMDALNAAIRTAEGIAARAGASQADVDAAMEPLTAATAAFNAAKQAGTKTGAETADKTALSGAIAAANDAKTSVVVNTAAGNVPAGTFWVTQAEITALNAAIAAAEGIAVKAGASQAEVDAAASPLTAAIAAFNAAKKAGTKTAAADKTALNGAITAANAAKAGIVTDTAAGNVPAGTFWVAQAEMAALNAAIGAAETVAEKTSATQAEADGAVSALTAATTIFNAAKKAGTKTETPPAADKAALTGAITAANAARTGVVTDTAPGNVPVGTSWVTQTEMAALNTAITAAETVAGNAGATQAQADGAASALTAATTTFNAAKKAGTKTEAPPPADKAALNGAIAAANNAKTGVAVDTAAGNVSVGTSWVTQAEMAALNTAIGAAETVAENAGATQAQADGAATALTAATTTFNTAKKEGSKQPPAEDKTALSGAIAAANDAKTGVVTDTAAGNVPAGTSWVTQTEMAALNTAIAAAETVAKNANATQAEVNAAVSPLTAATTTFTAAKKAGTKTEAPPPADKAALNGAITAANNAKTGVAVDTAAGNVSVGTSWVTQNEWDIFDTAIGAAEAVAENAGATQTQADGAADALTAATAAFSAAKKAGTKTETPPPADKTALNGAIAAANAAKTDVAVDTGAGNVPVGTSWVTQAEMTALNTAISAAEAVAENAGATQAEVDAAASPLTTATAAFNAAKKEGARQPPAEDKTALNGAITAANNAKTGVVVDDAAGNVPVGTSWVTQAEWDAFDTAITAAETVAENVNATQTQVDGAAGALTTAATTFTDAKKAGAKQEIPPPADKDALKGAIDAANNAKTDVAVDTDAGNVPVGASWVTQAEMAALNTAISAAETVVEKTNATQAEADGAATALSAATTTFNAAKKAGTKPETPPSPPPADKAALNGAITAANAAKAGVVVDDAAGNVPVGTSWVTQAEWDAFGTAISAADAVAENADAAQAEVNGAASDLSAATAAFNAAKKAGTKQPPADKDALDGAITAANAAKAGVVVDDAAGNVPVGTSWVTQAEWDALNTAISAAEAVAENAGATQAEVDAAVSPLTAATEAFNAAIEEGTFVAVTGITFTVPVNGTRGYPVSLAGAAAQPSTATYTTIVWTLKTDTDGIIEGDSFTPSVNGEVTLVAAIANGMIGADYSQEFTIMIKAPGTFGPTVGLGEEYSSIKLEDKTGKPLFEDQPNYITLGEEYSVHIDGDGYTDIAWFLNGRRETVTSSLIYLDTGAEGTIKLTVEGKRNGTPENSEIYTFVIQSEE